MTTKRPRARGRFAILFVIPSLLCVVAASTVPTASAAVNNPKKTYVSESQDSEVSENIEELLDELAAQDPSESSGESHHFLPDSNEALPGDPTVVIMGSDGGSGSSASGQGGGIDMLRMSGSQLSSTSSGTKIVDPRAGDPIRVVHIDPNAPAGGDGTFENPFGSISEFNSLSPEERASYDIIYVHPRVDGTSTNLEGNVVLAPHQRLLGTTVAHTVNTQFGTLPLPGQEDGELPVLSVTPSGGNVVTLGNNSEVSGFHIDGAGAGGDGITGDVAGFNINRNIVENSNNGASITTFGSGSGIVDDNVFLANSAGGFDLTHNGSGTLDLALTGNTADSNGGAGFFGGSRCDRPGG